MLIIIYLWMEFLMDGADLLQMIILSSQELHLFVSG